MPKCLYEVHSHTHTLLYIIKYEIKMFTFALDFFLCYSYVKYCDIPLFSMTRRVAAQKQCIIKKIVSVHNIFLHKLEMYSMQWFKTLCFQNPVFLYISIEMLMSHFVLKCRFRYKNFRSNKKYS